MDGWMDGRSKDQGVFVSSLKKFTPFLRIAGSKEPSAPSVPLFSTDAGFGIIYLGRLAGCTGFPPRSRDLARLDTASETRLRWRRQEFNEKQI